MSSLLSRRLKAAPKSRSNTEFSVEFKLQLLALVMGHLFEKNRKIVADKLEAIHRSHSELAGASFHFKYGAQVYKSELEESRYAQGTPLAKGCYQAMNSYIAENNTLENNAARVSAYINRGLNLCRTVEDLYVVLPSEMHCAFGDTVEIHRPNSARHISEDRLLQFRAQNREAHKDLKKRLVMNIILARV